MKVTYSIHSTHEAEFYGFLSTSSAVVMARSLVKRWSFAHVLVTFQVHFPAK
jgi:hypothetical protein